MTCGRRYSPTTTTAATAAHYYYRRNCGKGLTMPEAINADKRPSHRLASLRIAGVHPCEYASRWGDGATIDGCLFYNCSAGHQGTEVSENPEWLASDWRGFGEAIERQRSEVRGKLKATEGNRLARRATGWTMSDYRNLGKLYRWVGLKAESMERRETVLAAAPQGFTDYITCALWASVYCGPDDEADDAPETFDEFGIDDFSAEALQEMALDWRAFCLKNSADIDGNYSQAAHDFWLTRNRLGAGFWDRADDVWPKPARDRLTASAHAFGECSLFLDDGGEIQVL